MGNIINSAHPLCFEELYFLILDTCEFAAEEMDQADEELRETITHIWPLQAKKMLDLLVPRNDVLNAGKLTVGKIYAGLLILESWRSTRFKQQGVPVSTPPLLHLSVTLFKHLYLCIIIKIVVIINIVSYVDLYEARVNSCGICQYVLYIRTL